MLYLWNSLDLYCTVLHCIKKCLFPDVNGVDFQSNALQYNTTLPLTTKLLQYIADLNQYPNYNLLKDKNYCRAVLDCIK